MEEFDITAAYLHSSLELLVYMRPPFGLDRRRDDHGRPLVWKLKKSLYGLRQAGHNWMRDLFRFLTEYGLFQSQSDTSLWFKRAEDGNIELITFVHTDDGKIAGTNESVCNDFMTALKKRFNVGTHNKFIDRMFNIKVDQRNDRTIKLNMEKYIPCRGGPMSGFRVLPGFGSGDVSA